MAFGPFVLHRGRKLLLERDQPVRLGSRALELLIALVEQAGEIVSREALEARVWPHTVVEETSLRVHISALRKVLGDGQDGKRYINNLPGRGYCFVTPVARLPAPPLAPEAVPATAPAPAAAPARTPRHNLPERLTRAIGRADVTASLGSQLARRRLVSIVGPGGIGKTTVALAVARHHLQAYEQGAWFVDLAPLADASLVPAALAAILGTSVPPVDPWPVLSAFLADSRMLLVLDNCEHVIDAAAQLAEQILRGAPGVHILATSREPLEADGEWIHRLPALEMPTVADTLDVGQALGFAAVELFVERASASSCDFALSETNLPVIRQLCRQLDGIPLAIELAAARVDSLGLQGLALRLEDVFRLLTRGRRTALPRHRTLRALIDWSHDLLGDTDRVVLRRLSVFRAGFTLESAGTICACPEIGTATVIESVMSLCAQSLVMVDGGAQSGGHRLLYTTRTYAAEKLLASGELDSLSRRHAEYFRELLDRSTDEREVTTQADWLDKYARIMDDVRAGIDWAFSPGGDTLVGVALTASASDLALELSLLDEHLARVNLALDHVRRLAEPQPALELRLSAALLFGTGQIAGQRRPPPEMHERALRLAEQFGSPARLVDLLHSMCVNAFGNGDYPSVARIARRIAIVARDPSESMAALLSDRFLAMAMHNLGEHRESRRLARSVLDYPAGYLYRRYLGWTPRTVSMGALLARIAWLEGRADEAARLAAQCVQHAVGSNPHSMCLAIATGTLPVALWRGDRARAGELVDTLQAYATRHNLSYWQNWTLNYRLAIAIRFDGGSLPGDWATPVNAMELDMLGTLTTAMLTPQGLDRVESGTVGWNAPEILRAQGEALLVAGATDQAEALFTRSLEIAGRQQALAWELRTSCSLARLWRTQGRAVQAWRLLAAVQARFTEGFETEDLREARALLATLAEPDPIRAG